MSKRKPPVLSTVGYEGATLADFLEALKQAGVTRLLDIRELPLSRRKGFSKTAISAALMEVGIEYLHLRGLGDPKEGREAARSGEMARFRRIFGNHMQTSKAQEDLKTAANLVVRGGTCLMCFERDHTGCHRSIVAEAISASLPVEIRHLRVASAPSRPATARSRAVEWT